MINGVDVITPILTAEICNESIICEMSGAKLVNGARKLIESSSTLIINKVVVFDLNIGFKLFSRRGNVEMSYLTLLTGNSQKANKMRIENGSAP